MTKTAKWITICSLACAFLLAAFVYVKFFFVYSEGTNDGEINYFQREGFVFKTYEGKMVQSGLKSLNTNEFKFSVVDPNVAEQLNNRTPGVHKLHWKRYLGTLPWRGKNQFVVDSVVVAP